MGIWPCFFFANSPSSDLGLARLRDQPALPGELLMLRPGDAAVPAGEGGQDRLCGLPAVAQRSPVRPGWRVQQDRRLSVAGPRIKVNHCSITSETNLADYLIENSRDLFNYLYCPVSEEGC